MAVVFQHSTLAALMAGLLGGTMRAGDLLEHGDSGIGTLHGVDGEVIIVDGEVYQADQTGKVNHITDMDAMIPFATVHNNNDATEKITLQNVDMDHIDVIDERKLANNFSAIVLRGDFDHVKVRVAPKASEPFPSLLELAENQPVFDRDNVSGTLVGYYSPELYHGVVAAGWHVHFLSDDREFGGHVLDFNAAELSGDLTVFADYELHLPIDNQAFREHELDMNGLDDAIHAAEGNKKD